MIDICLAQERDGLLAGWQEHVRYNGVTGKLERWFFAWRNGVSVEETAELRYHDEAGWVERKKQAQMFLDLVDPDPAVVE